MDAQEVVFDLRDELLFLHAKILRQSRHMTPIVKSEKRVLPGGNCATQSKTVLMLARPGFAHSYSVAI